MKKKHEHAQAPAKVTPPANTENVQTQAVQKALAKMPSPVMSLMARCAATDQQGRETGIVPQLLALKAAADGLLEYSDQASVRKISTWAGESAAAYQKLFEELTKG